MLNPRIGSLEFCRAYFGLRDWWKVLKGIFGGLGEKKVSLMAAGVAFFAMLALFPSITATISLFGYVADPVVVQDNLGMLQPIIPAEVYELITNQVVSLVSSERRALGLASILSLLLAIWSARAGITAMMAGLSVITRKPDRRNLLWNMLVAYGLTVLLILVTIIAIGSVVIIPVILGFFPLGGFSEVVIDILRWSVAIIAVATGIGALYRYGPSRRARRVPILTIGNVLATLLWVLVSVLFSIYLGNFHSYNEVYGSLGAVIALLMWFYLSAFVVLLGAEVNTVIEDHSARIAERAATRADLETRAAGHSGTQRDTEAASRTADPVRSPARAGMQTAQAPKQTSVQTGPQTAAKTAAKTAAQTGEQTGRKPGGKPDGKPGATPRGTPA